MELHRHCMFFVLSFLLAVVLHGQTRTEQSDKAAVEPMPNPRIDCTGKATACNKPVKFLTKTASCICFTCGYKTPDAKQLCTKRSNEAKSFAKLARQSGFSDDAMEDAVRAIVAQEKGQARSEPVETRPAKGPS